MRKNIILILILVIATLLRFIGTNPGYNRYHNDEPIVYGTAIDMVQNKSLDPQRFDYPGGAIYINYIFFQFFFIPIQWFGFYVTHVPQILDGTVHIPISPLEMDRLFHSYILGGKDFYPLFWGRYIVALFSVGNVVLVYLLAEKLFNKRIALIASFLIAVNFRQVLNSHIDIPDIYNAFFLLLSALSGVYLWKNPTRKNYLLAGVAMGLSFSMKYQVFGFLPVVMAHLFSAVESKKFLYNFFNIKNILVLSLSLLLTFILFNPYFFIHFETAKMWISSVSGRYGVGANILNLFPISYLYHYDFGPLESVIIIAGLAIGLWKYPKRFLFLFSSVIPFMVFFLYLSRGGFYVRNFVTVTPILLIFAAVFLDKIFKLLKFRVLFLVLLAFVTFIPIRNSILNSYYYTRPWDYPVLSDWLFKNFKGGEVVAANPFDPPTGAPDIKKTEFELSGSYSMAEHKEDGASYALSNSDWAGNPFFSWMGYGFDELPELWNKPLDTLRNTFYGLSTEELYRYQIFSVHKVWQAPDETLVLAKIPEWQNVEYNHMLDFKFSEGMDNWKIYGKEKRSTANYIYDSNNGYISNGSIVFLPADSKYSTIRATSEPINIKPGYLYKIDAFLKSEKEFANKERDGFIRVDFYNDQDFSRVGEISAISSRIYKTNNWTKKEIIERAPDTAKYMTISFQMSNTITSKIWMDDVTVYESKEKKEDITVKPPYTRKKIDLQLLYTNSHANL